MPAAEEMPVPPSPGGASPKRKPKGTGVTFSFGSGTGSSTSPGKGRGGGMSTLEAQLSALLPALMEMVDAHTRAKVPPASVVSSAPPPAENPAAPPTQPGQRSGAAGLKAGDEGYRAPHNDVAAVVGDAAAAAKARAEAAAQKRRTAPGNSRSSAPAPSWPAAPHELIPQEYRSGRAAGQTECLARRTPWRRSG